MAAGEAEMSAVQPAHLACHWRCTNTMPLSAMDGNIADHSFRRSHPCLFHVVSCVPRGLANRVGAAVECKALWACDGWTEEAEADLPSHSKVPLSLHNPVARETNSDVILWLRISQSGNNTRTPARTPEGEDNGRPKSATVCSCQHKGVASTKRSNTSDTMCRQVAVQQQFNNLCKDIGDNRDERPSSSQKSGQQHY